ncbi:hypothetical protein [Paenibacillus kandeliae]|uniref:hypothetical protein n=1 Tax=Paenibacillus kandeliae TaxID=3231269 RepID=UPI0034590AF4
MNGSTLAHCYAAVLNRQKQSSPAEMYALKLAEDYVNGTRIWNETTADLALLFKTGQDLPLMFFEELMQRRDDAYADWNKAALEIRDTSLEIMKIAHREIERLRATSK